MSGVACRPTGLDTEAVARYVADRLDGAPVATRAVASRVAGGASNLTFLLSDGERQVVIRRPPVGELLNTAHDVGREHRVLSALADSDVPIPRALLYCTDSTVTGAPFSVSEHIEGFVARAPADLETIEPDVARACGESLVDTLAAIHRVDSAAVGLGNLGRPGYLERQLRRWGAQWDRAREGEVPELEEVARRLRRALPAQAETTLVHGDYQIGNVMLDREDEARVMAVLDWEMSTLGDPLADLGLLLAFWDDERGPLLRDAPLPGGLGFPTRRELAEHYARITGRDVGGVDFHLLLGQYKVVVIAQILRAEGAENAPRSDAVLVGASRALATAEASDLRALRA